MKTRIMGYTFTATWLKGDLNSAPDALSRNPTADPQPEEALAERDVDQAIAPSAAEIRAVSNTEEYPHLVKLHVRDFANSDPEYQKIKGYIVSRFPQHHQQLPPECRMSTHSSQ